MTGRIRIGIAGLGIHGMRYATHLLRGDVPGAKLVAISRADEAAGRGFAEANHIRFAHDPSDLATLANLDAVVLALPPDLHPTVAAACLRAGRPVLVEKPLAPDAARAAEVCVLSETTGTPLMVAQTLRFDPLVRALRERAATLGALRVVTVNQRFEPSGRAWIDTPGCGGCVLNTGVHGFDLLRFLTGSEVVSVQAEIGAAETRSTDDQFVALLRLEPGGILAAVDNARTTQGRSGRIELVGENGQLAADHIHRTLHAIEGRSIRDLGHVPSVPTVVEALREFTRALREGTAPSVTGRDGLAAVEIADAVLVSAREGRRVRLDEIRAGARAMRPS